VKHGADELQEGETMILTLADKNILDDKGDLDDEEQDELENVLAVCHWKPLYIAECTWTLMSELPFMSCSFGSQLHAAALSSVHTLFER
jgi:hypothetical protein